MTVSFIVPYHNEAPALLKACLDSILSLPLQEGEAEVIVIDDGSETSAETWVTALSPAIRYIRQENAGLSMARNHGIEEAKGDYLQFVDAEDCLLPTYALVLHQLRTVGPDMVMFRFTHQEQYEEKALQFSSSSGEWLLAHTNLRAAAWSYVFRKDKLEDLRFEPRFLHEDELFTPQLLSHMQHVLVTKGICYYYRITPGSIMRSASSEHIKQRLACMLLVISKLADRRNPLFARRIAQLSMDSIINALRLTRSPKAAYEFICALKAWGFYPLPLRMYTIKYFLFALLLRPIPVVSLDKRNYAQTL